MFRKFNVSFVLALVTVAELISYPTSLKRLQRRWLPFKAMRLRLLRV